MMRACLGIVFCCLLVFHAPRSADAQPQQGDLPNPKTAYTNPHEADADFAFQGEYVRWTRTGDSAGLQVVALGGGEFQAVWFRGGLPGAGWDRKTQVQLTGTYNKSGVAWLTGEGLTIQVAGGEARIMQAEGITSAGVLYKIRRISATQDLRPPRGAIVLFNGTDTAAFEGAKITEEGLLAEGPITRDVFGDFYMHLEFRTPYMPYARGQARGNSGVYVQRRYEIQVLDSFGLEGAFNEAGSLYRQRPPELNMALPPLSWQTYDIYFTAARFDAAGKKTANARLTLLHNGEPVQSNVEITSKTGAGKPEGPEPGPILLQNHGDPVRFRNIWYVPGHAAPACP